MADFAELSCALSCPVCRGSVALPDGALRFQWGLVPRHYASAPAPLFWLLGADGEPAPPYEVSEGESEDPWNAGSPEPGTVYAFDEDPRLEGLACPSCGAAFERVAARIEGDILQGAVAFVFGELERKVSAKRGSYDAVVVREDGSWEPRPDWEKQEEGTTILEDI
jgi:hypothetical protein